MAATQLLNQLGVALEAMPAHRYWIAYSGGVDSHVLLHAMASLRSQLGGTLHAVHVNHGLNPAASEWAAHCLAECEALEIPCHLFNVDGRAEKGESPEAAARDARYHAFSQLIERGDCLLTAHHQDDQAETLLLQLLRGAGPHGLAAMPVCSEFFSGSHGRPLLGTDQALIKQYASEKGLQWVDDPSNLDRGYARNFLRHEILPSLKSHWPALEKTLSRSAAHCAEAAGLLDELARDDLHRMIGASCAELPLSELLEMSAMRRRNLIRFWVRSSGLPVVSTGVLNQIEVSLLNAGEDAQPHVCWPGGEIRRYRDRLFVMPPLAKFDAAQVIPWSLTGEKRVPQSLQLPAGLGQLNACAITVSEVDAPPLVLNEARCQQLPMTIRFRQGGERCRLPGREHRHELKGLLQRAGVPPWQRSRIPLIYLGDELAAVVGHFCCAPFQAQAGERGIAISLQ